MHRLLILALAFGLAGCTAARKETKDTQTQQLQAQISRLKYEIQRRDAEIDQLEERLARAQGQKTGITKERTSQKTQSDAVKMTPKNIQAALKNAGFYNGAVDGKIGKMTKKAIMDFQRANGITADGVVGKQTWSKLSRYLE